MHDLTALGPAVVTDDQLTELVAALLGTDPARTEVLEVDVSEVDYDLPAITTAARHWVRGRARTDGQERGYSIFVKSIQSWSRHPFFQSVPSELREFAAQSVPWRTEAAVYRSDLAEELPEGLSMPRAVGVFDLDEESNVVWLEEVSAVRREWDLACYTRAAHLLGRLASAPGVRALSEDIGHQMTPTSYVEGRLRQQVIPMLHSEQIWQHPLVAGAFDEVLRSRLLAAAAVASTHAAELDAHPRLASHGDACPNNLLLREHVDGFVLIDFGFFGPTPVGFDLAQLLVGELQVGRRSAADLPELDAAVLAAYVDGLRAEGCTIPAEVVRRAHALQLLLFAGLSSLPEEHLDREPTPDLRRIAADRAAIARLALDLVDATG